MEQLPALITILCVFLLILTWRAAAIPEIPAGCKTERIQNVGASTQKLDGLKVSQEPGFLNATLGETMTLNCTFQSKGAIRAKVLWLRGSGEEVVLDSNHPFYHGRLNVSSVDEVTQGKATLILSELEERDSGFYQCCIDIYNEETGIGGGTKLRVIQRIQSETGKRKESELDLSRELNIYRSVVALATVGIILLAGMLVLQRCKATATETQPQKTAKRDRSLGSSVNENLHYAEITVKAPAHTEYASIQTQQL